MFDVNISWIAVLVAALAHMAVGMIWYNPQVFGEKWAKSLGLNLNALKPDTKNLVSAFVLSLVMAFVLALFISWTDSFTSWEGAIVGFWAAIGFILTTQYSSVIWVKKPLETYWIDACGALVSLTVMGALIGLIT